MIIKIKKKCYIKLIKLKYFLMRLSYKMSFRQIPDLERSFHLSEILIDHIVKASSVFDFTGKDLFSASETLATFIELNIDTKFKDGVFCDLDGEEPREFETSLKLLEILYSGLTYATKKYGFSSVNCIAALKIIKKTALKQIKV